MSLTRKEICLRGREHCLASMYLGFLTCETGGDHDCTFFIELFWGSSTHFIRTSVCFCSLSCSWSFNWNFSSWQTPPWLPLGESDVPRNLSLHLCYSTHHNPLYLPACITFMGGSRKPWLHLIFTFVFSESLIVWQKKVHISIYGTNKQISFQLDRGFYQIWIPDKRSCKCSWHEFDP